MEGPIILCSNNKNDANLPCVKAHVPDTRLSLGQNKNNKTQ